MAESAVMLLDPAAPQDQLCRRRRVTDAFVPTRSTSVSAYSDS
jgi:hypothetical protein